MACTCYDCMHHRLLNHFGLCRYTGHTLAKFCVTFATGLITGLTAASVVAILEFVFARKRQAVQWIMYAVHDHGLLAGFGLHLLITTCLLMAAALLVRMQACIAQVSGDVYRLGSSSCMHANQLSRWLWLMWCYCMWTICWNECRRSAQKLILVWAKS